MNEQTDGLHDGLGGYPVQTETLDQRVDRDRFLAKGRVKETRQVNEGFMIGSVGHECEQYVPRMRLRLAFAKHPR